MWAFIRPAGPAPIIPTDSESGESGVASMLGAIERQNVEGRNLDVDLY